MQTTSKNFSSQYFCRHYEGNGGKRAMGRQFGTYLGFLRRFVDRGSLLEIGCGYGGFLRASGSHYKVIGTDVSDYALRKASSVRRMGICHLVCASGEALPFSTNFDAIVALDCLEHLVRLESFFKELDRLQSSGGMLMVVVPVYDTLVGKMVGLLDQDETHVQKHSRFFWIEEIRRAGYGIVMLRGIWRYLLMKKIYVNFTTRCWQFSPAILVIARKNPSNIFKKNNESNSMFASLQ